MNLVDITITDIQQIDVLVNTSAGPTTLHIKPIKNKNETQFYFLTHKTDKRAVNGIILDRFVDNRRLIVSADDMTMYADPIEDRQVDLTMRDCAPAEKEQRFALACQNTNFTSVEVSDE